MIKKERLQWILEEVNTKGIITVTDIIKKLNVSDMTVRRDLDELDKDGLLIRIHGGAQSINSPKVKIKYEKSNTEKQELQIKEKRAIAKLSSSFIQEGETIFIGPGTTLEHFANELVSKNIRVITNSLPVFNILNKHKNIDLILTGGEYRDITGAFVGSLTANYLQNLKFSKAFVSANGIFGNSIATYSENEGKIQHIALDNAIETFLLIDHKKFDKYDFYDFYSISNINHIITDFAVANENKDKFSRLTDVIVAQEY
ncbi:DeoR/GlpR family DNA-binding transcription regulator [Streptococcus hyointestinalis]|uniref:DeoR/GlpR family DNA-binding transcription regulator n=1 Tax=Streptococcus hyointestinalis TaxID=1337 RepID=UPI0013E072AF|nr:DeoR/GlpR family DNA-binding transcription regulator [Streptococcus hyointestinalis]